VQGVFSKNVFNPKDKHFYFSTENALSFLLFTFDFHLCR